MNCPACWRPMYETAVREVTVDVCKDGCAGVWFDAWELRKLEEGESADGAFLRVLRPRIDTDPERRARRFCPRDRVPLRRTFLGAEVALEIDTCSACKGLWIDPGEIGRLPEGDGVLTEVDPALAHLLAAELGPALQYMGIEGERGSARAARISCAVAWLFPEAWATSAPRD